MTLMELVEVLNSAEAKAFLVTHQDAELTKLLLGAHKWPHLPVRELVAQLEAARKARTKLPSWIDAGVIWPPGINLEQGSSEATATYKFEQWPWFKNLPTRQVADLTLGMGVDAWAMAKSGFLVTGFERNEGLANLTAHNLNALGVDVQVQAATFGKQKLESGTLVYLDPDRRQGAKRLVDLHDCEPDATSLIPQLLAQGHYVMLKCSPMLDLSIAQKQLPPIDQVLALSWKGDCRELVFAFSPEKAEGLFTAVELSATGKAATFSGKPENGLLRETALAPSVQTYLYDPGPALNKLQIADAAALQWGLQKLGRQTWLYTSDTFHTDYPGRVFELVAIVEVNAKAVHAAIAANSEQSVAKPEAHVAVRGLPQRAEDLGRQLKLKEGGTLQIFITQLATGLFAKPNAALISKRVL